MTLELSFVSAAGFPARLRDMKAPHAIVWFEDGSLFRQITVGHPRQSLSNLVGNCKPKLGLIDLKTLLLT